MRGHITGKQQFIDKEIAIYGIDAFSVEIIEQCTSKEELNERERYYINYYDSIAPNGYNMSYGGGNNHRNFLTKKGENSPTSKSGVMNRLDLSKHFLYNKYTKEIIGKGEDLQR